VRTDELDYPLPEELIAHRPAERRDGARLLVHRRDGTIEHRSFAELVDLLDPDDLVVANTSRVLRARIAVRRPTGGSGEVLLLEERGEGLWEALVRPSRRMRAGVSVTAETGGLEIEPVEALGEGRWLVRPSLAGEALVQALEQRYQTVYARQPGSAAAPTAGLHFTPELWERLRARCEVAEVELRVGLDTFRPVAADTLEDHAMHSEAYRVEPAARAAILAAVASGRRVVCIGTTSVRVAETIADPAAPDEGRTSLLIAPGYRFRAVGALVTNFHLPRTTLLALVMAFCGVEETRRIYAEAIRERYRFYSFGDASFLI
jgi:S-adenosylmethionine:tRNA ribosyltransferase-isomerase